MTLIHDTHVPYKCLIFYTTAPLEEYHLVSCYSKRRCFWRIHMKVSYDRLYRPSLKSQGCPVDDLLEQVETRVRHIRYTATYNAWPDTYMHNRSKWFVHFHSYDPVASVLIGRMLKLVWICSAWITAMCREILGNLIIYVFLIRNMRWIRAVEVSWFVTYPSRLSEVSKASQ